MTSRAPWKFFVSALFLSGCQSTGSLMPWFASNEPVYTTEELASIDGPQPTASRSDQSSSMMTSASGNGQIQTVSATTSAPPAAVGRVDELVRFGQAAIREAGQSDPGKLQQARDLFSQALALDNNSASAHHGMAIVADLQKDWMTAELHYKQALRSRPQDPSLLNDIGYSYLLQNRYHEATQYLNQTLQYSPQHERAHINLALLSLKRGDRNDAQVRLRSIYSAVDAQTTLARLERDLQATGNDQQPTSLAMSNVSANAVSQQPMQPQRQMQPQQQMQAQQQMPPQAWQAEASQQQLTNAAPALNQGGPPVHVYPPGIELSAEPTVTDNQPFYSPNGAMNGQGYNGQSATAPQVGFPGVANAAPQYDYNAGPQYNANGGGQSNVLTVPGQQNQFGTVQYSNAAATSGPPVHLSIQNSNGSQQGMLQQMNPSQTSTAAYPPQNGVMAGGNISPANQAPLAGLNAGPGIPFPIGLPSQPSAGSATTASQPNPAMNMNYQYAPGNSGQVPTSYPDAPAVRNGAMYSAPQNVLPAEQHLQQMQNAAYQSQQGYQNNMVPASSSQYQLPNGAAGMPTPSGAAGYGQPVQPTARVSQATPYVDGTAGYPGVNSNGTPPQANSPLAAYERQLQSLDSQYNRALQQMDGSASGLSPAPAQYR